MTRRTRSGTDSIDAPVAPVSERAVVQYDQLLVYGGKYLAYAYCSPDMVIPELTRHSENLNALIAAHPDVTFYLYMVEGDSNNNFPPGKTTARLNTSAAG